MAPASGSALNPCQASRCQGPRPPGGVAVRHPGGDFGRLQPDLLDHAGLVPDQPFLDDHVALDPAIGDGPTRIGRPVAGPNTPEPA